MSAALKGKQMHRLTYDSLEHGQRINWLRQNAAINLDLERDENLMEVSEDGSQITLNVLLDPVVFQRYLKEFEPKQFGEVKKQRGSAPEGW